MLTAPAKKTAKKHAIVQTRDTVSIAYPLRTITGATLQNTTVLCNISRQKCEDLTPSLLLIVTSIGQKRP
jgi:hypothetical protein